MIVQRNTIKWYSALRRRSFAIDSAELAARAKRDYVIERVLPSFR